MTEVLDTTKHTLPRYLPGELLNKTLHLQVGQSVLCSYPPGKTLKEVKSLWPRRLFVVKYRPQLGCYRLWRLE